MYEHPGHHALTPARVVQWTTDAIDAIRDGDTRATTSALTALGAENRLAVSGYLTSCLAEAVDENGTHVLRGDLIADRAATRALTEAFATGDPEVTRTVLDGDHDTLVTRLVTVLAAYDYATPLAQLREHYYNAGHVADESEDGPGGAVFYALDPADSEEAEDQMRHALDELGIEHLPDEDGLLCFSTAYAIEDEFAGHYPYDNCTHPHPILPTAWATDADHDDELDDQPDVAADELEAPGLDEAVSL